MGRKKYKNILFSSYIAFICIIVIALAFSHDMRDSRRELFISENRARIEAFSSDLSFLAYDTQPTLFTLREHDKKIGVFDNSGKLLETINVYVVSLPMTDRELLSEGISVCSRRELFALIEDYTG